MGLERLPEHFKIDEESPLMFYYYDDRSPGEKSCKYTNLKSLVSDCKGHAWKLDTVGKFNLPEGFRIEIKINSSIPVLYFENTKIQSGDIFELEGIANKNHSIYRQVKALNEGQEIRL